MRVSKVSRITLNTGTGGWKSPVPIYLSTILDKRKSRCYIAPANYNHMAAKRKEYTVGQYAKLRGVSRQAVHIWILKRKDGMGNPLHFKKIGNQYVILSNEFNEPKPEPIPTDRELSD